MSGVILNNGYEISSFAQVDNSDIEQQYHDIHYNNKYFNTTLNPIEIIFIKNNRINNTILNNYIKWNN